MLLYLVSMKSPPRPYIVQQMNLWDVCLSVSVGVKPVACWLVSLCVTVDLELRAGM